ncbi:hypothetical protein GW932_04475 [archaeon]|nr:hypothetical protein [archaeon]
MTNPLYKKYMGQENQLLNQPIMGLTFFEDYLGDCKKGIWQHILVPTKIEFQNYSNMDLSTKEEDKAKFLQNRPYVLYAPASTFIQTDIKNNQKNFLDTYNLIGLTKPGEMDSSIRIENKPLLEQEEPFRHVVGIGYAIGKKAILDFYKKVENSNIYLPRHNKVNEVIDLLNYNHESIQSLEKLIETLESISKI